MILNLSDAASPWWIQVRPESSCFGLGYTTAAFVARRCDGTVTITVRLDLLPALLAAIEELLAHPAVAAASPAWGQSWSARRDGDEVLLIGPGHVHMIDVGEADCGLARTIDVAHGHLSHLRRAVANLLLLDAGALGSPPGLRRRQDRAQISQHQRGNLL